MTDAPITRGEYERDDPSFEERFPVVPDQPLSLAVHNSNGEVLVRATDRTDVLLRSVKHGRSGGRRFDDAVVHVDIEGNRIEIRARHEGGGRQGWGKRAFASTIGGRRVKAEIDLDLPGLDRLVGDSVQFDFEIEIPRARTDTALEVRNASGEVTVDGVTGTINVATASGDAHLRAVAGEVTAQSASGDVLIEQRAGSVTVRTASGDVHVKGGPLDRCGAVTASGDLLIDAGLRGLGPFTSQTVSGDVQLTGRLLAGGADPSATLTFHTVSGEAEVEGPFRLVGKRQWRLGPEAAGGTQIAVRTVSGDLRARLDLARDAAAADAPTAAIVVPPPAPPELPQVPEPPMPPAPPIAPEPPMAATDQAPRSSSVELDTEPLTPSDEDAPSVGTVTPFPESDDPEAERLAVLQALERGEIDVDEALTRLEAVGAESVG